MKQKKNPILDQMESAVTGGFPPGQSAAILSDLRREFEALCAAHPDQPKAIRQHTVNNAYPSIALYRALQKNGRSREEAYKLVEQVICGSAEKNAAAMRRLLKLPGLYKTMPFWWKLVTKNVYGEAAGFRFKFYDTGSNRVKFDMLECTYCRVFREEGCPELVNIFCRTDDINNENLHPRLLWNRTKTMGGGDGLCDFDLIVLPRK